MFTLLTMSDLEADETEDEISHFGELDISAYFMVMRSSLNLVLDVYLRLKFLKFDCCF